ncbi:unnamed protein product [Soboliphyme baturini]|uniref:Secreted protein n=1 Tax=Soboliphyme baturini TaxID=241478 RepID=A0A183INF9_9BILA|nr:unnamed protein product [Soboliphyme baturini]
MFGFPMALLVVSLIAGRMMVVADALMIQVNCSTVPNELSELEAAKVAELMLSKKFSLMIEFVQLMHTRGTLFSVFAGKNKVFELYSTGLKGW